MMAGMDATPAAETPAHPTLDDRIEIGLQQAKELPVEELGDPTCRTKRPDIVDVLRAEGRDRIAELLPLRHARMAVCPLATLRGSASVMATALGARKSTDLIVQLCGDAHLSNFGIYASPERDLVFDVNDFDETHPGPFEWDVLRLATSFVTCLQSRDEADKAAALARHIADTYRETMQELSKKPTVGVLYERMTAADIEALADEADSGAPAKDTEAALEKARRRTQERAIARLTEDVDGKARFKSKPPVLERLEDEKLWAYVETGYAAFVETLPPENQVIARRYKVIDSARKVVGVGSIGTRCFVTLLEGRDADDRIILQFKEATASVLAPHVTNMGDFSRIEHEGQRIVRGQKLMQAVSDLFLGWVDGMPGTNKQFFGRQLHDMKGGFDVESAKLATVELYADLCARTLARAHARSGDTVAIAAYLGDDKTFAEAVEVFAVAEAHFVAGDHKRLTEAIAAGEIEAADTEDA
jgi:uncharacterized protein (DUF2252 family)